MKQTETNEFKTAPILGLVMKFAIPCVISLLINSLYNIVDQIFIGRGVGYLGNGATNVVFPITVIALAFALLIGDGGAAWLSLKMGEGSPKEAKKGIGNAVTLSVIAGVLILIISWVFFDPLLSLFGCTDAIYPYAVAYGRVILIGLPFTIVSTALNSIIRADGSPQYAMGSMIVGAVINVILDPVFIFVFHWGVFGAALATIIGQIASFVISIIYLRKFKSFRLDKKVFVLSAKNSSSIASLGISSFITQISIVIVMAVTNNMLKHYGATSVYGAEIPITAMGITMKVNQIMISIAVGIAAGAQPIWGYNYGAKEFQRVRETMKITVICATAVTVLAFIMFQFFPMSIISLFGAEDVLYNEFAVKCFRIFLLACVLNGFQTIAGIFVQAIGKPIKSAVISLSRQIVFYVPATLILPGVLGIEGVLWSGPVADVLAFVLALGIILYEMKQIKKAESVDSKNYSCKNVLAADKG